VLPWIKLDVIDATCPGEDVIQSILDKGILEEYHIRRRYCHYRTVDKNSLKKSGFNDI